MLHSAWAGWRVALDGNLYSPEGWAIPLTDLRAVPLMRAQLKAYQDENFRLRGIMEDLEEQPQSWELPALFSGSSSA